MKYTIETVIVIEDGKKYEVRTYDNDQIFWYLNNKVHRENGPATFKAVFITWYQNDLCHRTDGPAKILPYGRTKTLPDGRKYWYINGEELTEQKHTKVRTILAFGLDKI